jgi:prepilin peptidase CpaA
MLGGLLMAAAWHDVRHQRIPNAIVFTGIALALALHTLGPAGDGFTSISFPGGLGFLKSLTGLGVGLAALLPLYLLRAAGAGDAKLMAMVGAFLGPVDAFGAVLFTFAGGAVLACAFAVKRRVLRRMVQNVRIVVYDVAGRLSGIGTSLFDPSSDSAVKIPYALAIGLGTAVWLVLKRFG